jgi:hypothetical protein
MVEVLSNFFNDICIHELHLQSWTMASLSISLHDKVYLCHPVDDRKSNFQDM